MCCHALPSFLATIGSNVLNFKWLNHYDALRNGLTPLMLRRNQLDRRRSLQAETDILNMPKNQRSELRRLSTTLLHVLSLCSSMS